MDRFFALLGRYGFDRPSNGYGGLRFRGLHQGYEKGAVGEKVAQESGLDYEEALMRAWRAVDAHARKPAGRSIFYAMCDETRVRDQAERELEFMQHHGQGQRRLPRDRSHQRQLQRQLRPSDPRTRTTCSSGTSASSRPSTSAA